MIRRLGTTRYDNARARAGIVTLFTIAAGLLVLVPSAIQTQENTTEVLVAIGIRIAFIGSTLALIFKIWNDSWWRRYSDEHGARPKLSVPDGPTGGGAEALKAAGVPVVEAPVIVVPAPATAPHGLPTDKEPPAP